jgi:[ribosomal protein S5]-alanine N-acetyltransferase
MGTIPDALELRPLSPEDVSERYISWLNDPAVYRHLGIRHRERAITVEDTKSFIRWCHDVRRFLWGIYLEGSHVGNVSCSDWNHANRWIDISYLLGEKDAWGRGIATAAVGAAVNYLLTAHPFNRVQSHAVIENIASIRVMEKLGMNRDALLRQAAFLPDEQRYADEAVYSVLRSEWPRGQSCGWERVRVLPMAWEG